MKAKPNFAVLASKAKSQMKKLGGLIEKMTDVEVAELMTKGKFVLDGYELISDDIKILPKISAQFSQYEADFDENVIVLLDVSPSQEMLDEGVLRDIVNRVQRLRKEFKLVPSDDITVYYQVTPKDSQLDALLKRSTEFLETNLKKPFVVYNESLTLEVKKKDFQVTLSFVLDKID